MIRAFLALAALLVHVGAAAQAWPARPLHWVVPFPPGGSVDVLVRYLAPQLSQRLGQPVVIENKPGAASNVGMEAVARAAPDGYTYLVAVTSVAINPSLYRLRFDPLTELIPIAQLTNVRFVLLGRRSLEAESLNDLLALARARPGVLTCAYTGGLPHIACELLNSLGAKFTTVPYKGAALAMNDLIGERVDVLFEPAHTAMAQVNAGRARVVAADAMARLDVVSWQGIMAPSGTPDPIVAMMNREIVALLQTDKMKAYALANGLELASGPPAMFGERIRRDHERYGEIIRKAGIQTP